MEIKESTDHNLCAAIKYQLIKKYARDPGTNGHGIYLVLWFGENGVLMPHAVLIRNGDSRHPAVSSGTANPTEGLGTIQRGRDSSQRNLLVFLAPIECGTVSGLFALVLV